jgi:phytochelatin synthase
MDLRRILIHAYFYVPYGVHKITGTGAFGRNGAGYINDPIQTDGNSLKASLIKHHVKQYHEASCSVATVVSAVNAIRDQQHDSPDPVSQLDILEKVRTANWKERMSDEGDNGRRGLPLSMLGEVVKSSLDAYGIVYKSVETVQAQKNGHHTEKIRGLLWNMLCDFEKKGNCLLIAHFDQGAYVPALNIPHISPVGGVDTETGNVIMLDVDPSQEKPYRITFDTFYKGISSNYNHVLKPFGYGSGGYVFVRLH